MKKLIVNGGRPLSGEITISGAKNSTVALIPAAILADSPVTLEGVPDIQDVHSLIEILEIMNVKVDFDGSTLVIDPTKIVSIPMPSGKIKSLRASYYFMGALLSKFGQGVVGLPGGCFLGPRPIDQHLKGFEALGATVDNELGAMYLRSGDEGLTGARVYLDVVSIGATINLMLAAVRAKGKTIIENAAREPEIIDVATLLNNMGAKVRGAGTDIIRIEGVTELKGCRHTIIPDRIEAGTYLSMAAAMGTDVVVKNVIFEHLEGLIAKMEEMGVPMEIGEDSIRVLEAKNLKMVSIKTLPYPGFATDLQQPLTPLLLKAHGEGMIVDTIYPKRVKHIPELVRMGAKARVETDMILLEGPTKLKGVEVEASDLRAGACLVTAGLMAEGTTTITGVENILRGYDHIVEKLTALGADIKMIEVEDK
ncbi:MULTISPECIES: UDP-N-acetylglucosamine 1-carboxyvinyltransferase [Carnobacterium]|jgi:UDP-N-acetylglucosamine 1-carboxyvinyltransferase|uniref:UDP-N-acetylglucosamine 1-carboxyvinyltransferase n=2 Tax=Carnobacterium maltaromaticum TaxID=2751 RepID=K8E679_CARML|nr:MULTISPECIES: UDP-N-acetylglucosamine 1-carboxyvinyltransferase [Carnobacterium]AOA02867.1 UDP-N-acetylglucosamine 1-carboxyvinyltransferase [Carnobacterium maltaromaticum]KRN66499.1 UDP-N-acetylglucosamine 1-carboxyvinyltransferase [Carnobacterium maltaromaticum DSM 20342]KRN71930.1 UDP-N-acetylglucosamine 1-carboxyvinyltransferase [Carnobacterium maltaromaticum]KRN86071.1 UDP-N-acetylglucosamine 1-carboxyvinyltransferase [Carnobacterium maltaromaticum]MBC9789091.1 UDP-N-acetylglucosamine 